MTSVERLKNIQTHVLCMFIMIFLKRLHVTNINFIHRLCNFGRMLAILESFHRHLFFVRQPERFESITERVRARVSQGHSNPMSFYFVTISTILKQDKIEGPGGTPCYGLNRYVRPQRVWLLAILVINRLSI